MSALRANVLGLVFFLVVLVLLPACHFLIWRRIPLEMVSVGPLVFLLAGLLLGTIAHELTHSLGWRLFGHVQPGAISFGFNWRGLMPYAHCRDPIPMSVYRISALLPAILTGLAPALAGLCTGSFWLTLLGALLLGGAGGDILLLWSIRSFPADARVHDHPTRIGCEIWLNPGNTLDEAGARACSSEGYDPGTDGGTTS